MEKSLSSPPEKRHYLRQPINAYVKLDEDNGGVIVDASETGLRVRAVRELEVGRSVRMRFQLNRTYNWTEAKGRIVWTGHTKKLAGIEFSSPPSAAREVLRGLLREASWPDVSNPGIDTAEPNASNQTPRIATTHSEVRGADSTPTPPFDSGAALLSKSDVPDVTKHTARPVGILKAISREIATPSMRTTIVALAILFCVLISWIIGLFR